jgi:hypothetical protein
MKHLSAILLSGACAILAQAQTLTNVTIQPTSPNECQLVGVTISGTTPNNGQLQGFGPSFSPGNDTLYIDLRYTGSGGGSAPFSQPIPGIAQFTPGAHWIVVTLIHLPDSAEMDEFTRALTVAPGTNPDPGEYGSIEVCSGDANVSLISILGGTPSSGGVWFNPNNQVVANGIFDPGQSVEGFYSYVFDLEPPCADAQQQVLVTYLPSNSPGQNGAVQVCATGGPTVDLFAELGGTPYVPGTWSFNGNSHGPTFVPGVDACGVYTYTVPGQGNCGTASAIVNVQCVQPPNAGVGGSIALCYNDSSENLSPIVTGEQTNGVWIDQAGFTLAQYNQPVNCALNGAQNYGYLVTSAVCPNDTSFVAVTLVGPPCTIGMDEQDGNIARFELMPNPAQTEVVLELELQRSSGDHWLELTDVNGRILRTAPLNIAGTFLRHTINVSDLPRGAYMVRIASADGSVVRRLMVK